MWRRSLVLPEIKGIINTIMHEKSVFTLEYPKIMEKVAREAAFSASKELVKELQPAPDLEEARRRLAFTTEAYRLIELRADAGVQGAISVRRLRERPVRVSSVRAICLRCWRLFKAQYMWRD
jgi:dsDNA-specific endonuclease/ATPase MutS2